jgi:hypothetical protein
LAALRQPERQSGDWRSQEFVVSPRREGYDARIRVSRLNLSQGICKLHLPLELELADSSASAVSGRIRNFFAFRKKEQQE